MNEKIMVRDILTDPKTGEQWRVIFHNGDIAVIVKMNVSSLQIKSITVKTIMDRLSDKTLEVSADDITIISPRKLSPRTREKFLSDKSIAEDISKAYGPTFLNLVGKQKKDEFVKIAEQHDAAKSTVWKITRLYLQGGLSDAALIDGRYKKAAPAVKTRVRKPGRKSAYGLDQGKLLTETDLKLFDQMVAMRTKPDGSAHGQTWDYLYHYMLDKYYSSDITADDGSVVRILLPANQRPTYNQFHHYVRQHAPKKALTVADTSAFEENNQHRLHTGSAKTNLIGPGDCFEIDACEVDAALVSRTNPSQAVGRAIVYIIIDVWTSMIMGVSIAFDNNSVVGLTNAIYSLALNKHELCSRYDITFEDDRLWPTGYKPLKFRVDHGSDFISKDFNRIAEELNVDIDTVPVMNGSMKGTVEHIFHMINQETGIPLIMHGKITKRYDSKHHKQAVMTVEDYTKIVLSFVLSHNSKYMVSKLKSEGQIEAGVRPIPAELWTYYCDNFNYPRMLPDDESLRYTLCVPAKAVISSDMPGFCVNGLYYECDLYQVNADRYRHQRTRQYYAIRIDPRNTSYIYILDDDNHPVREKLIASIPENNSYRDMTWKRYEYLRRAGKIMDKQNEAYRQEHKIALNRTVESIVDSAASRHEGITNNTKDMVPARSEEKEAISVEHSLAKDASVPTMPEQNASPDSAKGNTSSHIIIGSKITMEERKRQIEEIARRKM